VSKYPKSCADVRSEGKFTKKCENITRKIVFQNLQVSRVFWSKKRFLAHFIENIFIPEISIKC
jgi:hypothetical protein